MCSAPSIASFVLQHAVEEPGRHAISDERSAHTYEELARNVRILALSLQRRGIRRGDFVAALTPPRSDAYTLFLALNLIGAIWVGLNPRYKLRELRHIVEDAKPKALFFASSPQVAASLEDIAELVSECACLRFVVCFDGNVSHGVLERVSSYSDLLAEGTEPAGQPNMGESSIGPIEEDIAAVIYTSGSTGKPKGVLIPNRSMIHRAQTQGRDYLLKGERPRCYAILPLNHVGGLVLICAYCVVNGGAMVFRERFDVDTVGDDVLENRINILIMLPTMYQQVFASPRFRESDYRHCQIFLWAGGTLPTWIIDTLRGMGGGEVRTNYGASELCSSVTRSDPDLDTSTLSQTIGYAIEDELRVVKPDGMIAAIGEIGEAQVRNRWIMKGYLGLERETRSAFTDDGEWFKTGDLMMVMEDGRNLKFVGRVSNMLKSGGYNVYPTEIENWIVEHQDVKLAVVVGKPDDLYGEVGHAIVVPKEGRSVTEEEMKRWCQKGLANYKVPKSFEFRGQLPMLANGKVDLVALKAASRPQS